MTSKKQLFPYQRETAVDLHEKQRVIIADAMGMGKCAQALYGLRAIEKLDGDKDYKTLVVSPYSVMPHWQREVGEWYSPGTERDTTIIRSKTFDKDVERAKDSKFVVMSYPTLSYFGKDRQRMTQLENMGFDYSVLDEGHNLKNPEAVCSSAIRGLIHKTPYLSILTGTPLPNTIEDLYVSFNLLEPDIFPINTEKPSASLNTFYRAFSANPELMRDTFRKHLAGGMPRTREDYPHIDLPQVRHHALDVELTNRHKDVYMNIYENDSLTAGTKLWQLVKASLDPNLVNPRHLETKLASKVGSIESCVYSSLDNLLEQVADEGGKVLMFSELKTGVTDYLRGRWKRFNPLIIDGDTNQRKEDYFFEEEADEEKRELIRQKFQKDPDCKLLIATTTMNEGVDLTAATSVVDLRLPYTPHAVDQRHARTLRIGEVKKDAVDIYRVKSVIPGIRTIDQGIERLLDDKRTIINFLMESPTRLTREDIDEFKRNGHTTRSRNVRDCLKTTKQRSNEHKKRINEHLSKDIRNKGFFRISELYKTRPDVAENFANRYAQYWEGSYGGNTANLYDRVIHSLEESQNLSRKLDIASGPFSLSRKIKEPVTNVDINPFMLQAGKLLEERGEVVSGNIALEGCFHDLPLEDESFDMALCSLAYHASKIKTRQKGKVVREREQAFKEMNRVLRPGGFGIFTLPRGAIKESDFSRFYNGLDMLGLDILPFSGFYQAPKGSKSKFRVYLGAVRKSETPQEESLDDKQLEWHVDRESVRKRSGRKKKGGRSDKQQRDVKTEVVNEFVNTRTKETLEDAVRQGLR